MALTRSSTTELTIAPAVADVISAAREVITDRVDLTRMMVRSDVRELMVVAAYGSAAVAVLATGAMSAAGALVWVLALWLPLGASLGVVAVLCTAAGVSLLRVAAARQPSDTEVTRVLPGDEAPKQEALVSP